jgi:hypothetical protein
MQDPKIKIIVSMTNGYSVSTKAERYTVILTIIGNLRGAVLHGDIYSKTVTSFLYHINFHGSLTLQWVLLGLQSVEINVTYKCNE